MSVRAKFKVTQITEQEGGIKSVMLMAVTNGSEENKQFFKWTPSASIDLSTLNTTAAEQFVPGKEFYVDFTEAPKA